MSEDLFTRAEMNDFISQADLIVIPRQITVYDASISYKGISYDIADIYEVLVQLYDDESICVTDPQMVKLLKSIGAIDSAGSYGGGYPASTGPNFEQVFNFIESKIREYQK